VIASSGSVITADKESPLHKTNIAEANTFNIRFSIFDLLAFATIAAVSVCWYQAPEGSDLH